MYRREFAELIRLALPLVVAQLAQNTISFVDTLMVGRLGNEALAGMAIGGAAFFFVFIVLSGVVLGVGPIVSQAVGAKDPVIASRAVRQGLWVSLFLAIPAMVIYWNAYPILIALGQSEATAKISSEYLQAISWGMFPALGIMALRGYLEGHSDMRPIMILAILGIGANVCFNYVLMFGKFGFPTLGLAGTGYASSLVFFLGFLILATYIAIQYRDAKVFRGIRKPDRSMIVELFRVGGPIGMTLGFEISMFSAAALAMGTLGSNELAAHQIALQSASIAFMVPLGVAIATSVRVGQAIGRKSRNEAKIAGHVGMMTCCAVMCISAIVFCLFPRFIIGLYIDANDPANQQVVTFAVGFLAIAALFQIVDGLQVSASSALRGLKDTKVAMILSLISYWGVGVTVGALLCFQFDLKGNGLWLGMTVGLATAAILLSSRFQYQVNNLELKSAIE